MDPNAPPLELHDIQGLVARGYGPFPAAEFLLLRVRDGQAARAREYLRDLHVTPAAPRPWDLVPPEPMAWHLAFTHEGLAALGVAADVRATFSREFIEGLDHPTRAEQLGDEAANHPDRWTWGRAWRPHVLLMVYASTQDLLASEVKALLAELAEAFEVRRKPTRPLEGQREHFGFRDGISTPFVEGLDGKNQPQPSWTTKPFAAGEFILGYPNEYRSYSETPTVPLASGADLDRTIDRTALDLGRNGTYLVFRELRQFVPELWDYLKAHSREPGADAPARAIALGAKLVGRWPGGAPRTLTATDDEALANANGFEYANLGPVHADELGMHCPIGSHIRRTNPRDQLHAGRDRLDSIEMVRKHQMLRRGRTFGEPIASSMNPRDIMADDRDRTHDGDERGLYFICLVGHIGRQFELVQRAWVSSPVFGALSKDGDPLLGVRRQGANQSDELTVPAEPVRRKYKGLPELTRVTGGAYFFLPGLRALRYLLQEPAG